MKTLEIIKIANKFEKRLKEAQMMVEENSQPSELKTPEPKTEDIYEFQSLLDSMFPQSEKNKIANQIANEVPDDLSSLKINVKYDNKSGTIFQALVNGGLNQTAQKILGSLKAKVDAAAKSKGIVSSKYDGWITYPKK